MDFETFFRQHEKRAWNLARAWTRTAADADDVLQESLVVAWQKQQTSWPWFANVIKNVARNHNRKKAMDYLDADPADQRQPSNAEQEELAHILHSAMQRLGEEEREAVALICVGGLSAEEASECTGTNVNTLRSRYQRGLQHLRQNLKKSEDDLKCFLASLPFGVPRGGWEASRVRWLEGARQHHRLVQFKIAGTAGVAASIVLIALLAPREWFDSAVRGESQVASSSLGIEPEATPSPNSPTVKPGTIPESLESVGPVTEPPNQPADTLQPKPDSRGSQSEVRTRFTKYENGVVEVQWTEKLVDGKYILDGRYAAYYSTGSPRQIGQYSDGVRCGTWTFHYPNGNVEYQGEFIKNVKSGLWKYFYDTQELESQGEFKEGRRDGEWRSWHKNTQVKTIEPFKCGLLHGTREEFFEDGSQYLITEYQNGKKHGVEIEYDKAGRHKTRRYKLGELQDSND
jgi:RNA polymerase sigma factor (sigma-70 family)